MGERNRGGYYPSAEGDYIQGSRPGIYRNPPGTMRLPEGTKRTRRAETRRKKVKNPGKDLMSDAESRQRIQGANRTGNKRVKQRKGVVAIPTPISRKRPGNAQGLMSAKNVKNKKRKK